MSQKKPQKLVISVSLAKNTVSLRGSPGGSKENHEELELHQNRRVTNQLYTIDLCRTPKQRPNKKEKRFATSTKREGYAEKAKNTFAKIVHERKSGLMSPHQSQITFMFSRSAQNENIKPAADTLSFIPNKLYSVGEKGSGLKTKGEPQNFYHIRDTCLSKGTLFEDPQFPANDRSITCKDEAVGEIKWLRPHEIAKEPRFVADGFSRFAMEQGTLGDCWVLAALASLTLYKRMLVQIIPEDQDFDHKYAGVFHFRIWQFGRWLDVVVDDRLPTINGQLCYLSSSNKNEFWISLFEKAYAKLHSSYDALSGGRLIEVMENITGGITEDYDLSSDWDPNFFAVLKQCYDRCSIITCAILPGRNVKQTITDEGLLRGPAYTVTKVIELEFPSPAQPGAMIYIPLMRLRSPWDSQAHWRGPFCEESREWDVVPKAIKKQINLYSQPEGEFWMHYHHFAHYFDWVDICNLSPDSFSVEKTTQQHCKKWQMFVFEGQWVPGVTAGGNIKNEGTFHCNPQYRITLTEPDEKCKCKCTLILSLMQKNKLTDCGCAKPFVKLHIYIFALQHVDDIPNPLTKEYLKTITLVSSTAICSSSATQRYNLRKGTFLIIPTTGEPNERRQFILRAFTEKKALMKVNDNDDYDFTWIDNLNHNMELQSRRESTVDGTDPVFVLFSKISEDEQEVDWQELKAVLDETFSTDTKGRGFSTDACRSMIAMFDVDFSGKLSFDEFKILWINVLHWKEMFFRYDEDHSGTFSHFELKTAFESAGFRLSNRVYNRLMQRYGNKKGELNFEDFIMCAVRVKSMIDLFKYKAKGDELLFKMGPWLETMT